MAKINYMELYKKYSNTYDKLEARYGVEARVAKLTFDAFRDGFKDYKKAIKTQGNLNNMDVAVRIAEDSVFRYSKEGAEQLQKYAKDILKEDISLNQIRLNKNSVGENILNELRTAYEQGKIDGELHDSSSWKLWASSYIFGSE